MKLLNYIHYENTTKPTLVILHGLLGSSDNWRTISKKLVSNFNIFCFDLRNHGNSFHDESMTYIEMVHDVLFSIKQLQLKVDYIIGHSMGGKVVMRLLQENNLLKKSLILDIAPIKYSSHHQDVLQALQNIKFDNCLNRTDLDAQLKKHVLSLPTRQLLMKNITRSINGDFFWKCNHNAILNNYNLIMDISHSKSVIQTPTLFVRGGKSDYVKIEYLNQIHSLFSTASIETFEDVGHWVQVQAPDLFIQTCLKFFK